MIQNEKKIVHVFQHIPNFIVCPNFCPTAKLRYMEFICMKFISGMKSIQALKDKTPSDALDVELSNFFCSCPQISIPSHPASPNAEENTNHT